MAEYRKVRESYLVMLIAAKIQYDALFREDVTTGMIHADKPFVDLAYKAILNKEMPKGLNENDKGRLYSNAVSEMAQKAVEKFPPID